MTQIHQSNTKTMLCVYKKWLSFWTEDQVNSP